MARHGMNANLPLRWLSDPRFMNLSAHARDVHVLGLMSCLNAGSDGHVTEAGFDALRGWRTPRRMVQKGVDELVAAGLWSSRGDGVYQIEDWSDSQTTSAERDQRRESERQKKERQRAELRQQERSKESAEDYSGDGAGESSDRSDLTPSGGRVESEWKVRSVPVHSDFTSTSIEPPESLGRTGDVPGGHSDKTRPDKTRSVPPRGARLCRVCQFPLHATVTAEGGDTCPSCDDSEPEGTIG